MSGLMNEAFRDPLYLRFDYKPDCRLHTADENDRLDDVSLASLDQGHGHTFVSSDYEHKDDFIDDMVDDDNSQPIPVTPPTKVETKNPRRHQNEVIDIPEAGQRVSSASCSQIYTTFLTFALLLSFIVT